MFCLKCGKSNAAEAAFCGGCGTAIGAATPVVTPPQNIYAAKLPKAPFVLLLVGLIFALVWALYLVSGTAEMQSSIEHFGLDWEIIYYLLFSSIFGSALLIASTVAFYNYKLKRFVQSFRYSIISSVLAFVSSSLCWVGVSAYNKDLALVAEFVTSGSEIFLFWLGFTMLVTCPYIASGIIIKRGKLC
jgi:uncharacterized integral membrane protein